MRLCALPMLGLVLLPAAYGQTTVDTIHVLVLNGRSGKPVKRADATVDVYPKAKYETPTAFTADLRGSFSLLVNDAGDISTRIQDHRPCERLAKTAGRQSPTIYPVSRIQTTGVVTPNTCGRQSAVPQPGTLTLYVRPTHWWGRFF